MRGMPNAMEKKLITVLIPCYNEEESFPMLCERLRNVADGLTEYNFEFLFIDDGSSDSTASLMKAEREKDRRVSYVTLSRNYGKETAMCAGFDYAKGDAVVIMDADLQHPPELIGQMAKLWSEGYDDVYAKRTSRKGESFIKKFFTRIYYRFMQRSTRYPVYPDVGDFRLLDRRCIEAIKKLRETQRNTKNLFAWIGYKKIAIEYEVAERQAGKSKWSFMSLVNLAIDGITSSTTAPLRLSMLFGIFFLIAAFIYMLVIIIKAIAWGIDTPGYSSLMVIVLFIGGVQLFSLGVISEYLGKIFNESKGRPVYFADEYNGRKISNKDGDGQ